MPYVFKGSLCGYICSECPEPLSDVTVRLYRHQPEQNVTALAVANPKDTFAVLDSDAVKAKEAFLIAEVKTDPQGGFVFNLSDSTYKGEAFEIDLYCGNVPHRKFTRKPPMPRQITLTTVQPMWKRAQENFAASWDYCIPYRFWCWFRGLFDAWTICGKVTRCDAKDVVANVKVTAFDTDWKQDDNLGFAFTDAAGRFRIDYTRADFEKTIFSPLLNVELFGGPDLYFRIEDASGNVLLQEPSARGRERDRENAGPCFCVDLCVDVDLTPPFDNPWFTNVGDFDINGDITAATGLANKQVLGHGGAGFGFFGNLKLKGFCPKTSPIGAPDPMRYRFLYTTPLILTPTPITPAMIFPVNVGSRLIQWDVFGTGLVFTFQAIYIQGSGATPDPTPTPVLPPGTPWGAPPAHVIVPDADGWVAVDQNGLDSGFYGPLLRFKSDAVVSGGAATGSGAGVAPADPKLGTSIGIIFEAGPVGLPATFSNTLPNILINNWSQVAQLDLVQFHGAGATSCSEITTDLDIQYTADHELMAAWNLGISSAASFPHPILPGGTVPRGGFGTQHLDVSTWPACSYVVGLGTQRKLTDGETDDPGTSTQLTFCK